jgi:hypothetical protein
MKANSYSSRSRIVVAALLVSVVFGCRAEQRSEPTPIRPAYGLPDIYLGMQASELDRSWLSADDVSKDIPEKAWLQKIIDDSPGVTGWLDKYRFNPQRGMEIALDDEKETIAAIFIYFRSKDYKPFAGTIEGGITADTSIEETIRKLGQPTTLSVLTGIDREDYPGATSTNLYYYEGGIGLQFIDGKLAQVDIRPQKFDYERVLIRDMGDTRAYRAIVPENQIGKVPASSTMKN